MLLFAQYPLADFRQFVPNSGRLNLPYWPDPVPYKEFVRSFGQIRPRTREGLAGWVGENKLCFASNAVQQRPLRLNKHASRPFTLRLANQFLYSDGTAVAHFDLVFVTRKLDDFFPHYSWIDDFSACCLTVRDPKIGWQQRPVEDIGSVIASLYSFASSKHGATAPPGLVESQSSSLIIELHPDEDFAAWPRQARHLHGCFGIELVYWWHRTSHGALRICVLRRDDLSDGSDVRRLRIVLGRLHSERECLTAVLRAVESGRIDPDPGSQEDDDLQAYFKVATRRVLRATSGTERELASEARDDFKEIQESFRRMNPGWHASIRERLERLNVRRQVLRNVMDFARANISIEGDLVMRNKIEARNSKVGVMGGTVNITADSFAQTWNEGGDSPGLSELADELATLREHLRGLREGLEADVAVGQLAAAEQAARDGDAKSVFDRLKGLSKWVWETATKIGTDVAAKALGQALGMPT